MYFKRKAYDQLVEWKDGFADRYAVLLEGARRVGKSTIAERTQESGRQNRNFLTKTAWMLQFSYEAIGE